MFFDFGSAAKIQTSLLLCTVWPEHLLLANKLHEDKIIAKKVTQPNMHVFSTILRMRDKCYFLMGCLIILHILSLHIELF